jgi:hypothetical protein
MGSTPEEGSSEEGQSIADHIKHLANKKRRTKKTIKTPEDETVNLEGKDVNDGQEGKA